MLKTLFVFSFWLLTFAAKAETIPALPPQYFNDFAGVVSSGTSAQLNQKLNQLDRDTTTQIVVAIYPKMETKSSIEDYTFRIAEKWKVGQKNKNNGAVLFVFVQDRQMFLQVGYGLEAVLPDALAKQIIEYEIKPEFQRGNYDQGLTQGVDAILAAVQGTYSVKNPPSQAEGGKFNLIFFIIFLFFFLFSILRRCRRGFFRGPTVFSSGGFWGGGGGGGFSGGGGSFGGGGAGGRW